MNDEIQISEDLSRAVQLVSNYLGVDGSGCEACDFGRLLRKVQIQEARKRRDREEAEARRQEQIMQEKLMSGAD